MQPVWYLTLWGNTWKPIINIISGAPMSVLARLLPGQAISKYKGGERSKNASMFNDNVLLEHDKWVKWEDYSLRHVPQLLSRSCCCCRSCWCRWEQAQIRDIEYQSTNSFEEINWIQREWECCLFRFKNINHEGQMPNVFVSTKGFDIKSKICQLRYHTLQLLLSKSINPQYNIKIMSWN